MRRQAPRCSQCEKTSQNLPSDWTVGGVTLRPGLLVKGGGGSLRGKGGRGGGTGGVEGERVVGSWTLGMSQKGGLYDGDMG